MTEAEWLRATEPVPMLDFLNGKASERKLILFCLAWAATYAIETANGDPAYDSAMRLAEVGDNVEDVREHWLEDPDDTEAFAVPQTPFIWARLVLNPIGRDEFVTPPTEEAPAYFRDLIGNPFRPVVVEPAWLTSTVVALAEGIYQDWAFDRLPILADALQDAGCDNDDVLNHCRSDGPHVRGCWVVDLLTGRK